MMEFSEIAGFLRKCGYSEYDTVEKHRVFYEFDKMDFLYSDCAKKFECDYLICYNSMTAACATPNIRPPITPITEQIKS